MQRILVVDDDHLQVDVVTFLLRRSSFEVSAAFDAPTARRLFDEQSPDLVILDIQLGEADGRDLLRQFRKQRPGVLILMLTALGDEDDRVRGLELGADDYLAKPFGHRELIARVRALLRRASVEPREQVLPRRLQAGTLVLDPMTHEVTRAGRKVDLSPTEFRLLQTLMQRSGTLVPTRALLKEVWGHQDVTARNVLRVTASRLRAKIEDPHQPPLVQTVPGEGLIVREVVTPVSAGPSGQAAPPASIDDTPVVALDVVSELQEVFDESGMHSFRQLSETYVQGAPKQISDMRIALDRADAPRVAELAHRLRGNSATLGAHRVVNVSSTIERRSRAGSLDGVDQLLSQLEQEVSAYQEAMIRLFS